MACIGSGEVIGSGARDELKSQFSTREGTYRLASAVEFSRATRPLTYVTNNSTPGPGSNPHVRLSFVTCQSPNHRNADGHSSSPSPTSSNAASRHPSEQDNPDAYATNHRLCFNLGKEIFIYPFTGGKPIDMSKPIDKRVYKGTNPTCHEFNPLNATFDNLSLLIGFSGGQIQLVDPISKEVNKLYNEERIIEKTRVTCIHWIPNSLTMFVVSHASGNMYLYDSEAACAISPPNYNQNKQGPGYSIWNHKGKVPKNPLIKWTIGEGAINEFAFSPCGQYIAFASQDGFLRIFRYDSYELTGLTRSYFGGLLCVCWSPDGKFVAVGGEDDLVTIWSFKERRVVGRGQGHKSYVQEVAFDPFTTTYGDIIIDSCGVEDGGGDNCHHHNECSSSGIFSCDSSGGSTSTKPQPPQSAQTNSVKPHLNSNSSNSNMVNSSSNSRPTKFNRTCADSNMRLSVSESLKTRIPACYRIASIGQDTQLCLWDLTEDILKQPFGKTRPSSAHPSSDLSPNSHLNNSNFSQHQTNCTSPSPGNCISERDEVNSDSSAVAPPSTNGSGSLGASSSGGGGGGILSNIRFGGLSFGGGDKKDGGSKEHKRNFSLGSGGKGDKKDGGGGGSGGSWKQGFSLTGTGINQVVEDPLKLIGTQACPRLDECPLLEPLICKKISHERLTSLVFREDNIVTVCQDGVVCTWSRPGDGVSQV